jgi:hypothetical protein
MAHHLGPFNADAFFLVAAIHRVWVLAHVFLKIRAAPEVRRAIDAFERESPDAKKVRDVLTHLDDYALGGGRFSEFEAEGLWWPSVGMDFDRDEFDYRLGTLHMELKRSARAAIALAATLNEAAVNAEPR